MTDKLEEGWQKKWGNFSKLQNIQDLNMYFEIDREFRHTNYYTSRYNKSNI